MDFRYSEDEKYFADRYCNGDVKKLEKKYGKFFDFRPANIKRKEFNGRRKVLFLIVFKRAGSVCRICKYAKGAEIDHIIPLSSNYLNKKFRKMKPIVIDGRLKKVPAESYGSNNLENLQLVCRACNRKKWHHFMKNKN